METVVHQRGPPVSFGYSSFSDRLRWTYFVALQPAVRGGC